MIFKWLTYLIFGESYRKSRQDKDDRNLDIDTPSDKFNKSFQNNNGREFVEIAIDPKINSTHLDNHSKDEEVRSPG